MATLAIVVTCALLVLVVFDCRLHDRLSRVPQ